MKIPSLSGLFLFLFFLNVFALFFPTIFAISSNWGDANEGKKQRQQNTTNGDRAGERKRKGDPMPACRFPPRLREPARRTTAPASASRRRRGTTA